MSKKPKAHRYRKQRIYFMLMKPLRRIKADFYKYGFYILLIILGMVISE